MRLSKRGHCWGLLITTAVFGALGYVGSFWANSYSLVGDAAHLIGDGLPYVAVLPLMSGVVFVEWKTILEWTIRWLNRFFLVSNGLYLFVSGLYRLYHPHEVEESMMIFAALEIVGNSLQAFFASRLHDVYEEEKTHRSQMAHLVYDIGASAAIFAAAVAIKLTGISLIDAWVSILLGPATLIAIRHIESHGAHHDHGHAHHDHAHHHHH